MEIASSTPLERENIPPPVTSASSNGSPPLHPITPRPRSHDNNPLSHHFCPSGHIQFQAGGANAHRLLRHRQTSLRAAFPRLRRRHTADQEHQPEETGVQALRAAEQYEERAHDQHFVGQRAFPRVSRAFRLGSPRSCLRACLTSRLWSSGPLTPLNDDALSRSAASPTMEEEKAIAEKKFYLHPSPRTKSGEPQLLPLFPVTSPRVSGSY
ncbi:hypothetical protein PHJA_000110900 [Phtheirospermum japonicum]|uniref:Uncharacterized protein n=1 Tax=Phtheirospermum japonicum TaxID=374723 RepID=A0A830B545_9LAMI|nr:hypothetical protein PHJA_000110900 [Phtheirospermum japonicum]